VDHFPRPSVDLERENEMAEQEGSVGAKSERDGVEDDGSFLKAPDSEIIVNCIANFIDRTDYRDKYLLIQLQ
jgi:hypothetical protein